MKRKTMRNWFIILFALGLLAGWLIPMNFWDVTREASQKPIQAGFYDVAKRMGQLDQQNEYIKFMVLAEADTGKVQLIRLDGKIPLHVHKTENHFVYLFKGRLRATIANKTSEISPGQMLIIPAGYEHSVERVGEAPVEAILFITPIGQAGETVYLEKE